ncbi:Dol-P-Man:Man(7)GlcNAc(2)-PP-Dol alpha-1,6-mannosyltransferase [Vitis vinifera]|uniref:Mannosyltransferase n=1 Tax=Vitis vinifera TaxID=29760 RepID=A0A438IEU8_VITVI|nr:Dol-P-Man:Man(7)GlcNAc(2)-PP-Dol alpha-1,6-mannosyltransferase [Vitis vinifera]
MARFLQQLSSDVTCYYFLALLAFNCCCSVGKLFLQMLFECVLPSLSCISTEMTKSISLWESLKCGISTALLCIGLTTLVDTIMWKKLVWPEFEVLWFNSVLNRSSEWGVSFL